MTDPQTLEERVARQLCEPSYLTPTPDATVCVSGEIMRAWEARLPAARAVIATVLEAAAQVCDVEIRTARDTERIRPSGPNRAIYLYEAKVWASAATEIRAQIRALKPKEAKDE